MANVDMNFPLFKGKTFSDILSDIYDNQQSKKKNISSLIEEMRKAKSHFVNGASVSL